MILFTLLCDAAAPFLSFYSLKPLLLLLPDMDALVEAATVRLGSLGWVDPPAEFVPWVLVGLMLLGLVVLAGCRCCFGDRQLRATAREDTMQDLLKQNFARSLAPAQVQAWVDAMAPITGTVDDSMIRMHSKLEEVAGQILETMGVQVKNFGEKQLAEIRAQFVQLADAISDVAKVAQLHQPLSDVLESVKAQVKGTWNLDAEDRRPVQNERRCRHWTVWVLARLKRALMTLLPRCPVRGKQW